MYRLPPQTFGISVSFRHFAGLSKLTVRGQQAQSPRPPPPSLFSSSLRRNTQPARERERVEPSKRFRVGQLHPVVPRCSFSTCASDFVPCKCATIRRRECVFSWRVSLPVKVNTCSVAALPRSGTCAASRTEIFCVRACVWARAPPGRNRCHRVNCGEELRRRRNKKTGIDNPPPESGFYFCQDECRPCPYRSACAGSQEGNRQAG